VRGVQRLQLDTRLEAEVRRKGYLAKYIAEATRLYGPPRFHNARELDYSLKGARDVNILYAVSDMIYVHVVRRESYRSYGRYIVIEPPEPNRRLMDLVEFKLATAIKDRDAVEDAEEKRRLLLRKLEEVVQVTRTPVSYERLTGREGRIPVYTGDYEALRYYVVRNMAGLGFLEPFLQDPWLEDVTCRGAGNIYVVHKLFGTLESNRGFTSKEELDRFVIRLAERVGKPVSHARPIIDATLPDGSRLNLVFGEDVSLHGSNFTIRKFAEKPVSVTQLIAWNTMDERVAAYLWMLLSNNMSGMVVGETASGKTTTLNALAAFIPPNYKVVTIEDTAEVRLPHPNWVRELARVTGSAESSVTLFDLLKAALRQRPNYIIVGEIRGAEASVFFQALQTGHPGLATFHAGSVDQVVQRLVGEPIRVPKAFIPNLNFVLIQNAVWRGGQMVRRVISVNEIVSYDPRSDSIVYVPVFTWDSVRDRFTFRGRGASFLLESKIASMAGLSRLEIRKIYEELDLRAEFLKELVNRKILDYFKVWEAIKKTYEISLEDALAKLRRGSLKLTG
jgi:flagellar protein FlaI